MISAQAWTAAGWTMVHVGWIGAGIGGLGVLLRRLTRAAAPEVRYALALACFALLVMAPVPLFWRCLGERGGAVALAPAAGVTARAAGDGDMGAGFEVERMWVRAGGTSRVEEAWRPVPWMERVVEALPAVWLAGAIASLGMMATGLFGVERLRRASRRLSDGPIVASCRALGSGLGVARGVGVAVCDRITGPVLVGVVRPWILLPAAAVSGWSVEQVEMVLLHELAHVRRWDNLVNLLQRLGEAVLFFHPAAWWLSGWARLERELCCDRLVVERTRRPSAYAEFLVALAGAPRGSGRAALALADRAIPSRVRRILGREDRGMMLAMPEGLGLLGPLVIGAVAVLASPAGPSEKGLDRAAMLRRLAERAVAVEEVDDAARRSELLNIAEQQLRAGDAAGARSTAESALDGFPRIPEARMSPDAIGEAIQAAQLRRRSGDAEGARGMIERVTAIVESMPAGPGESKVGDAGGGVMRVERESASMAKAELIAGLVEERLALGDREEAARLARAGVALATADASMGPILLAAFGEMLHRAGDSDGAREALGRARATLEGTEDAALRGRSLAYVARSLFKVGESEAAIALIWTLDPRDQGVALREAADALGVDDADESIAMLETSGIKLTFGAPGVKMDDPETARPALRALSEATATLAGQLDPRSADRAVHARAMARIADLQSKAGDHDGAIRSAAGIFTQLGAPADGFGDAIRPAMFAILARRIREGGEEVQAVMYFGEAEKRLRSIEHPRERIAAGIVIARERARCGMRGEAIAVLDPLMATALAAGEPLRSRALAMIAEQYVEAGDIGRAEGAADATRAYPGFERMRAMNVIANRVEKERGADAGRPYRARAYAALSAPAPADAPALPAGPPQMAFTRDTFMDPEQELWRGLVENDRKQMAIGLRARLGDVDGAVAEANALPGPVRPAAFGGRMAALATIVAQLVQAGEVDAALAVAETAPTPAERLAILRMAAYAVEPPRR
jgi:tetratricopeptide (TPR) repeat protein